jgi:dTDP-4-dehydrorhamnose 3,5-epimerase
MVDIVLDIRKGSPTLGKVLTYDMPVDPAADSQEWIWVPPGFAHGNVFSTDTVIEYFCSGEYSQGCEAGISPFAPDLDWSLCEPALKELFDGIAAGTTLVTDKDRNGLTLAQWLGDERSNNFTFQDLA